jgi:hypothetical protein
MSAQLAIDFSSPACKAFPQATQVAIDAALDTPKAKRNQTQKILILLSGGGWVDAFEMLRQVGSWRVSARIWELRHKFGIQIDARLKPHLPKGEQYWQYRLMTSDEA